MVYHHQENQHRTRTISETSDNAMQIMQMKDLVADICEYHFCSEGFRSPYKYAIVSNIGPALYHKKERELQFTGCLERITGNLPFKAELFIKQC